MYCTILVNIFCIEVWKIGTESSLFFLHIMIYLLCKRFRRKFTIYCFIMILAIKKTVICTVHFWLMFWRLVRKLWIKCDILSTKNLYYGTNKLSAKNYFYIVTYVTIKCYWYLRLLLFYCVIYLCYALCSISMRKIKIIVWKRIRNVRI